MGHCREANPSACGLYESYVQQNQPVHSENYMKEYERHSLLPREFAGALPFQVDICFIIFHSNRGSISDGYTQ